MDIPRLDPTRTMRLDSPQGTTESTSAAPIASNANGWAQALDAQRLQPSVPARLNLAETIIRTERQLAAEQPLSFSLPARLTVPQSATTSVATKAIAPVTTASTSATKPSTAPVLAAATPSIDSTKSKSDVLPLSEITQQDGLLQRADVHFDPGSNRWSAEWPSPRPFHYGMVLKPTLTQFIKDGQSFSFQTGNDQVQTITNRSGDIVVGDKGGSETVLDSQGLRRLLTNKIKSNGFELYLTQTGSLVLATTGNLARSLASAH